MADSNQDAMEIDSPSQNQVQLENATDSVSKSDGGQPLQRANEPPESTTCRSDVSRQASSSREPSTGPPLPLVTSSGSSSSHGTHAPVDSRETQEHGSNYKARRPAAREPQRSASGRESQGPNYKELMEVHNKLAWDYRNAAGVINEQKHDIRFLEKELTKLKSDNEFLSSEIVGFRADLKAVKADLTQSNDRNRTLKNAIANMHASNSSMITDAQISKDYQFLISQIKNWTLSHFCDATPKHTRRTIAGFGIESDDDSLTATAARKYLKEDSNRRFLVIGMLVMRYLDEHIFRKFLFGLADFDERYLSGLGEHFKKTATPKEERFWCSTTAQMISATEGHRHKVQERKKELVSRLELVLVNTIPDDGDMKERVDGLKVIVDQAANLALALSVQRAKYSLYSPPPGKPFTSYVESTEDSEEGGGPEKGRHEKENSSNRSKTSEKIIELTVYPALFKRGNEDGEKYDEVVYVCNARALQKAPQKSMISRILS